MKNDITQLHNICPEEFKNEILSGVQKQLEKFSQNFKPKDPITWITRKEASELIGVSLVTIHNWTKEGVIKAYKIGNRVRFKKSEIEETLLNSNKRASK